MIYIPQFVYSVAPPGFRDRCFTYFFDGSNTPGLDTSIPGGGQRNNIILQLQNDGEFHFRALKVQLGADASDLQLQIKDPAGFQLSAAVISLATYVTGSGAAVIGRLPVSFEPETVCPAGGNFEVNIWNPTGGALTPPGFTFYGFKRFLECAA